jgi:CDP-diacylglycerol---serine O-phosphatidyltransferase
MNLLRHIPNALTCGNLLCGCFGIVWVLQGPVEYAAYFVWAACVFDFLDGFAARALHVASPIGKELDSLADVVSFGVLPSMAMYSMIRATTDSPWLAYLSFLIAVFSALRLAQFNIAENQKDSFIGVPTPATALFLTALPFLPQPLGVLDHAYVLVGIVFLFSFLLVSPWELFALKFKNFSWRDNRIRFTFLLLAVLLLAWLQAGAIPLIILLYIGLSLMTKP